jgi:hypothetical protein
MLAIDPLTGAMYTFPDAVSGEMDANPTQTSRPAASLTIVSTETLSADQMKQARLVAQADSVK